MENDLSTLFSKAIEDNQDILVSIQPYEHPLVILFRTSLKEQESTLHNLLSIFNKEEPSLGQVKIDCATLYHANQVAILHFNDWGRAVSWSDSYGATDRKVFILLNEKVSNMQSLLVDAAIELQQNYGDSNVKYFIPTFYLSKQEMEG
ncbi:hypothetical protein [Staphylococcus equorum]|uniref:hypothetical protein n=1 Tax=Staphylococcus equorum TaxID=246432 RepID=UPI0037DA21FD